MFLFFHHSLYPRLALSLSKGCGRGLRDGGWDWSFFASESLARQGTGLWQFCNSRCGYPCAAINQDEHHWFNHCQFNLLSEKTTMFLPIDHVLILRLQAEGPRFWIANHSRRQKILCGPQNDKNVVDYNLNYLRKGTPEVIRALSLRIRSSNERPHMAMKRSVFSILLIVSIQVARGALVGQGTQCWYHPQPFGLRIGCRRKSAFIKLSSPADLVSEGDILLGILSP